MFVNHCPPPPRATSDPDLSISLACMRKCFIALALALLTIPATAPAEMQKAKTIDELAALFDSTGCKECHDTIYAQWEKSHHARPFMGVAGGMMLTPVITAGAFTVLDNYQAIFAEIIAHRVDGAFFGSMNGAIAQIKGGEVLARPVDLSGVSTYTGVIFARINSGITSNPATWKGKRVAFVNKVTTAGYLYPLSLLRLAGYAGAPEKYFKKIIFSGLGVRPDLAPEMKRRLREALLAMDSREDGQRVLHQFQAQRFVATTLKDYIPVLTMTRQAEIDLATWPLRGTP